MMIHPLFATKGSDMLMLYMLRPAGLIPIPHDDPSLWKNTTKLPADDIYKTFRSSMETVDSEDAVEVDDDKEPTSNLPQ